MIGSRDASRTRRSLSGLLHRSRPLVLAVVLALAVTGCGGGGTLTVETEFTDVADLVPQAPVFTADVRIGTITDIVLTDQNRARVTMDVERDTGLPADVRAVLRQTSLLGERMVELVPTGDSGSLADGTFIDDAEVETDLEQLVATGNDLLAYVAADQLNAMVHAGATTFGGRGGVVGQLVDDLETFVGDFEADQDEILRLLDSFDALLGTLAQEAETHGEALEALARSNQALMEEDERLLDALADLGELGDVGERILRTNRTQFEEFFAQLEVILAAITGIDGALQDLLTWLPRHNLHVPNAQRLEFVQIWLDVVTCDTSSERRDDPSASCVPPNPGEPNEAPPGFSGVDSCDREGRDCPHGHPVQNEPNDYGQEAGEGEGSSAGGSG